MPRTNPIKRIFDLYLSDLSVHEIERLIKRDASEVYEFFASDLPQPDRRKSKFVRAFIFMRNLFNAFILKLTPVRRVFYLASIVIFLIGYSQDIGSYVIFSFLLLNLLLAFELADKLMVKDDLELARKIQSKLMPQKEIKIKGYDYASFYESAREVGGDYFDVININGGECSDFIIIGDISGKGLPAALYMVRVQAIVHTLVSDKISIKEIFTKLNHTFSKNLNPGYFLTLEGANICSDGRLQVCRAGHMPLLHYSAAKGEFCEITPKGMGIGLNNNSVFETSLEQVEFQPEKDDLIFFYTDGVTETRNPGKMEYGLERAKKVIKDNASKTPEEILNALKRNLSFFRNDEYVHDDITMIMLKRND